MASPQKRARRALHVLAQRAKNAKKQVVAPKAAVPASKEPVPPKSPKRRLRKAVKTQNND